MDQDSLKIKEQLESELREIQESLTEQERQQLAQEHEEDLRQFARHFGMDTA